MPDQVIDGVGDEVVLFGAFFFLSLCIVGYMSLRGQRAERGREGGAGRAEEVRVAATEEGLERSAGQRADTASDSGRPEQNAEGPTRTTGDQNTPQQNRSGQQETEGTTLRSRVPHNTQPNTDRGSRDTREEGEGLLPIQLVLPTTRLSIRVPPTTSLGELRRMQFQEEVAQNRPVRFIYQGRVLEEDSQTLQDLGIAPHNALHLHIGQPRPADHAQNAPRPPAEMFDLSFLFFPLFGLILAICWVAMLCFPHVFSLLTKVILFFLSLGYIVMGYSSTLAH